MKKIATLALGALLAGTTAFGTVALAQTAGDDTTTTVRTTDDGERDLGWLGLLGLLGLAGLMRKKHDHHHDVRDTRNPAMR